MKAKLFMFVLMVSPPARGRGLKLLLHNKFCRRKNVAPRAGAWIETVRIGFFAQTPEKSGRDIQFLSKTF